MTNSYERLPRARCYHILPSLTLLMQALQNSTRIFYWDVNGTLKYGTVESTSRMTDVRI